MIQAIRHDGDLPGGIPAMLAADGDNLVIIYSAAAADDPDGVYRFNLANSLLDEVCQADGDFCLAGQLTQDEAGADDVAC